MQCLSPGRKSQHKCYSGPAETYCAPVTILASLSPYPLSTWGSLTHVFRRWTGPCPGSHLSSYLLVCLPAKKGFSGLLPQSGRPASFFPFGVGSKFNLGGKNQEVYCGAHQNPGSVMSFFSNKDDEGCYYGPSERKREGRRRREEGEGGKGGAGGRSE